MLLKIVRFLSLLLVALILGLTFCHVMEIPGKLRLAGAEWLTVQHNLYIAFGPPAGAPIEISSIALTWLLVFMTRSRGRAFGWTLGAAVGVTAGLAVWFALVAPMNAALNGWTPATLPSDWRSYRNQWELGHAIHCVLFLLAFSALVIAILIEAPDDPAARKRPD
jgi:hypothetical protein